MQGMFGILSCVLFCSVAIPRPIPSLLYPYLYFRISNRGPIKTSINAMFIENYTGGILGFDDDPKLLNTTHTHGVSIVGWGYDEKRDKQHWIIRNSWGQYWGEMGLFRIELGRNLLGVEENMAWANPSTWATQQLGEEDDDDCFDNTYIDPSLDVAAVHRK